MSTAAGLGYNYVFELASQLSTEEQERLVREIRVPNKKNKMVEYTVPGTPIISQEDIEEINRRVNDRVPMNTPEEIKRNNQELLDILLNCPVMTDEELKGFEEARKEINECRLAYL